MNLHTLLGHALGRLFQVLVEMVERVLLDAPGQCSQARGVVEIGEQSFRALLVAGLAARVHGELSFALLLRREAVERLTHEATSRRERSASRSTCARCSPRSGCSCFWAKPFKCRRQPMSAETSASASV